MDRIFQWVWDRYGPRYSWAIYLVTFPLTLPTYLLLALIVVAYENSDQYVEAAGVTVVMVSLMTYVILLPGLAKITSVERCSAGDEQTRTRALDATYTWARATVARAVVGSAVLGALLGVVVGLIAGAGEARVLQYGLMAGAVGIANQLIAAHSFVELTLRPVRLALGGETDIGDSLPRSRPTFATWSNVAMLAVAFNFALAGAMLALVFHRTSEVPVISLGIASVLVLGFALPVTVGAVFSPSLLPIRDLADGTERVAAGDYSQRVPVVQDDDLGALAGAFNRMQAGLAERQRLQGAFGTYVDPMLAARLLEQGDDVFTGERRAVTVMFVDIRDFTPFAEANSAEDTVARLNALFEIVVPAVVEAGGHVNKFLGDGAMVVFGAPNDMADHADAAVAAAVLICRLVAERFGGELRIGIGINTGVVIAGTIGARSKLEFTLIGDTVNVAARVEQLTKTAGDAILLTQQTVDALHARPPGLVDRGAHALKGKSAPTVVFGLDPAVSHGHGRS